VRKNDNAARKTNDNAAVEQFRGQREMRQLAMLTIKALEQASLADEARARHDRVLARRPEELMDHSLNGRHKEWHFKPMVELLLREVHDIARAERPIEERRHEVSWVLDMSGF
jgi:hypothetical protein